MALPLETDPQDVAVAADGDILIDGDGLHLVAGIDAVVQAVRFRILLFLREWFLNMGIGVPYFEELLGDASKVAGVKDRALAAFTAAILDTPAVTEIISIDVTINNSTRKMTVRWAARTLFGDTPVDLLETP